ncbi:MAG: fructose-6-phosphate aldolase [Acidobacteriota bacterium]|jgi:transaldolase|nr:fructose-6-phosphate aldolase [Acidobacteriota bacterium]NLT32988.1 fructose-6-phosphate aldolase [Acidobacteriota bacterium]
MKFFLDTANIDEIREAAEYGLIDGVTTNPSLVSKEGRSFKEIITEIARIVDGPISAEVVSTDAAGMLAEAYDLAKIHENIVIKIPMIKEGMKALKQLTADGIHTNVTLVFSSNQALVAAKLGATYVSPFVGRFDDISQVGMELVADIAQIFSNYDFETQILVASCRNPLHIREAALLGAHVATMPYSVLEQLLKHPLTDIGLARFLKDWEKVTSAGKA